MYTEKDLNLQRFAVYIFEYGDEKHNLLKYIKSRKNLKKK